MSGLDDLIPASREVSVGGKTIVVRVLRVRQYSVFTRQIAKPFPLIVMGEFLAAITEFPDEIMGAVCAATDLAPAFVAELDGHEFLRLADAVLELNLDFFARAVLPATTKMARTAATLMTAFSGFSPDSSVPDTATTTSLSSALPN